MSDLINLHYVISAVLFSAIGLGIFILGFIVLDLLTPKVQVWRELVEKQNIAVAIVLGSCMLGIAIIIASAVHG